MFSIKKIIRLLILFFFLSNVCIGQNSIVKQVTLEEIDKNVHLVKIFTLDGEIISYHHHHLYPTLEFVEAYVDNLFCLVVFKSDFDSYHFISAFKEQDNWYFDYPGSVFNIMYYDGGGEAKVVIHNLKLIDGISMEVDYSIYNYQSFGNNNSIEYPRKSIFEIGKYGLYDRDLGYRVDFNFGFDKYSNSPRKIIKDFSKD